jgi:hypothetical protein
MQCKRKVEKAQEHTKKMNKKINFSQISILLIIFLFKLSLTPNEAEGDKLNSFTKSLLYFENGEKDRAFQIIKSYESEITDSLIANIIISQKEKDENKLEREFEIIKDLEERFKERIKFEKAKILLQKGEIEKAEKVLIVEGESNLSPADSFILSNIELLKGNGKKAESYAEKAEENEMLDKVKIKKLKKEIKDISSVFDFNGKFFISPSFSTKSFPVLFEDQEVQKRWDIVNEISWYARADFMDGKIISPFLEYNGGGEFYTDVPNISSHTISVGAEANEKIVLGSKYSLNFSTFENGIFSLSHLISLYSFPTKFIFSSLGGGIETKNEIEGRKGPLTFFQLGSFFHKKEGNMRFFVMGKIGVGKRFAQDKRFAETFITPNLDIFFEPIEKIGLNIYSIFDFMNFPESFEGRSRNLIFLASSSIYINQDLIEWHIIRFIFEGNESDNKYFSWSRIRIGTFFKVEL